MHGTVDSGPAVAQRLRRPPFGPIRGGAAQTLGPEIVRWRRQTGRPSGGGGGGGGGVPEAAGRSSVASARPLIAGCGGQRFIGEAGPSRFVIIAGRHLSAVCPLCLLRSLRRAPGATDQPAASALSRK